MQASQVTDHSAATKIAKVVADVTPDFSSNFTIDSAIQDSKYGVYVEVRFMRADPKYTGWAPEQTFTWKVKNGTLHIHDTYVPDEMRSKGFLGSCLSKIRQIPELNGTAVVHVAVNPAWPKILQRAGFVQKSAQDSTIHSTE